MISDDLTALRYDGPAPIWTRDHYRKRKRDINAAKEIARHVFLKDEENRRRLESYRTRLSALAKDG